MKLPSIRTTVPENRILLSPTALETKAHELDRNADSYFQELRQDISEQIPIDSNTSNGEDPLSQHPYHSVAFDLLAINKSAKATRKATLERLQGKEEAYKKSIASFAQETCLISEMAAVVQRYSQALLDRRLLERRESSQQEMNLTL